LTDLETQDAIETLRLYLREWVRRAHAWRPELGYPQECPFVKHMVPVVAWGDSEHEEKDEQIADWIIGAIDAEVEGLPEPHRGALRLVWLREREAVYRSNRMSLEAAYRYANDAERMMIPGLIRRGVVL